jgi:adenosine kinase
MRRCDHCPEGPALARVLICGTLAYDEIGTHDAAPRAGIRNVKLTALHEDFGGCAMNIAYGLAQLGHEAVPLVYVGDDYAPRYAAHVAKHGIREEGIVRVAGTRSARAIILSAADGTQFTAFHPGPTGEHRLAADLDTLLAGPRFDAVVIAPDLPSKSVVCARAAAALALRVWCPGQYAELLDAAELEAMLPHMDLLVANRHEWEALARHMPAGAIAERVSAAVVTGSGAPVTLLPEGIRIDVPPVPADAWRDPTGCGDAFAAALTGALCEGRPLPDAVSAGIALAGRCLRYPGAQNH